MRMSRIIPLIFFALVSASGCGGGAVGTFARNVDEVVRIVSANADEVAIPAATVEDFASSARVPISDSSRLLEEQRPSRHWNRLNSRLQEIDEESDGALSDTVMSNACDAAQGDLTVQSVLENFAELGAPPNAVADLETFVGDLSEAIIGGDSYVKVNALAFCYAFSQA